MRRLKKASMLALLLSTTADAASATPWQKHAISDGLSPISGDNSSPCAGASGIVWVSESRYALAFWHRNGARYITPFGDHSTVYDPSLWSDEIAYAQRIPPGETEILYWKEGESHQITYSSGYHSHPSLFAGNIAWDRYPSGFWPGPPTPDDSEIWFWNGYGAWQVTDNDVEDVYPSLYELTIAWQSDAKVVCAPIPHPQWGRPLRPTVVAEGQRPSLYANKIAYHASDGHDTEIFLYDIESAEILQITDNEYYDGSACLYEGTLVWCGFDGDDSEIFYWDGKSIQQVTENKIEDTDPSLWGRGLNTTIAYVERRWAEGRIICARPAVMASAGPGSGEMTLTWPSLEGRAYRVEYSDDLTNWHVATQAVPSAGYGETSWTDDGSKTGLSPSLAPRRFYRILENPQGGRNRSLEGPG